MSAGLSVRIEKLTKDNFDTWRVHMEAILVKNDLWSYVDGTTAKPEDATAAIAWQKEDRKAKADIILAMSPSELCNVRYCDTSHEVWTKLEQIYQPRGPARKATLLKQLLFTKLAEDGDMVCHLKQFFTTIDKLKEIDIEVAEDLLAILLLYSIPGSYENFRCAIESRDQLPTIEALKIKLLEESEARREMKKGYETQQAFVAKSKAQPFKSDRSHYENKTQNFGNTGWNGRIDVSNKKSYKCNYCHKPGHKAATCWKRANDRQKHACHIEEEAFFTCEYRIDEKASIAIALNTTVTDKDDWCVDSGATSHMCNNETKFSSLVPVMNQSVRLAVNKTADIKGVGTIQLTMPHGNGIGQIRLENVLYVPDLKTNLLSVSKAVDNGKEVIFTKTSAQFKNKNGKSIAIALRRGDLFFIKSIIGTAATVKLEIQEFENWHRRYGHLNEADMKVLATKSLVKGISYKPNDQLPICEVCIKGKQTVLPFQSSKNRADKILDLIHSDVCGPMRVKSIGNASYFVTFIDDKSRWVHVYFLKTKAEVKEAFKRYKALVENQKERKIKILRTDNGLEYCGIDFSKNLEACGIERQRTVAHTPQQNGVSERMNKTLVEMARCMILQANFKTNFWAEAISTAAHIRNRCPSKSLLNATPYEVWTERKPNVSYFKTFGCRAFALEKTPGKDKFQAKSKECLFVGYSDESKAYRLWDCESKKIIKSRDVKFIEELSKEVITSENNYLELESDFQKQSLEDDFQKQIIKKDEESTQKQKTNEDQQTDDIKLEAGSSKEVKSEEFKTPERSEFKSPEQTVLKRGPGRPQLVRTGKRGAPKKLYNIVRHSSQLAMLACHETIYPSVEEALTGPYANDWHKAMQEEFDDLNKSGTWELQKRPKNKAVIGCRWVLRTKLKQDGTIDKRKARLVAKGYNQQPGIDFKETFAPVARMSSVRMIVALAVKWKLKLYQLDVIMAFINGELEEELYMEQAEGFEVNIEKDMVYRLKRSLYGLKQASRQWFAKLDQTLRELHLQPIDADKCVYFFRNKNDILLLLVYVDDIIIATNQCKHFVALTENLKRNFRMKDLGPLQYYLGIEFYQDIERNLVTMSQQKYILDVMKRFEMLEAKPSLTPMESKAKLSQGKGCKEEQEVSQQLYQSLIGALMYAAVGTRADIAYSVSMLSRFNQKPTREHWITAKRVLRYLGGTSGHGLIFNNPESDLEGYVDSDWGGSIDDRISQTGFAFKLSGAAITWESRRQRSVALSSVEAEYMALSESVKEAVYLRNMLIQLGFLNKDAEATILYCDSQGAQKLMKNAIYHSRTKHIDVRYHYVRETFEQGKIDVKYLSTCEMIADVLTKSLSGPSHRKCTEGLGIKDTHVERGFVG